MTENTELNPTAKEQQVTALAAQSEELTPEQKKQQAREKAPDTGLSDAINSKKQAKGALATDLNSNDTNEVLAAVATASAKPVVEYKQPPGSFDAEPKKSPTTSQAGWTAFSKLPNPGDEKALEALKERFSTDTLVDMFKGSRTSDKSVLQNDLLAQYLKDSYFGEWYHNAGCIMFTVFFTWLITKLGGGLMACLVVGAFLATYYQTSIRRLRRNVRDDIERELAINRLETDSETADWINHFVSRFWLIYEPVLSAQIIGIADAILIENTPSFLDSIRLSTFTLGTKPFRINSIKTCPRTEPNVVCMDWSVSFTPNDVLDMTQRDLQSKVNPKIVLTIRVGKGMIGAGMPVLLEDLAFSGKLRLKFKFFNEFPHVKTIEASFLEKPQFDYSLKPVGGETFGFDINNIPGLQSFIQEQVHATLGPMMYAPNVYTVDVAGMMAGTTDLTSANGVLAITIYSATNLKGVDLFGSLDPYVTFHVGNIHNAELARTTALEDTSNPKWDETHFVLLNSLNESLYLQVMDRNSGRKDASVGVASFDLKQVAESDNVAEGLNLVVLRSGKPVGEIKCDMRYFPVSKPDKKEDGTIIPAAESNTGVLRFSVHECKQLGGEGKSGGIGLPIIGGKDSINAYAIVKVNGKERLRTKVFKRSINPRWDKFVEIFVADKTKLDLSVTIMDSREFADDEVIGRWSSSLTNMEEEHIKNGKDWWHLKDGAGQIHLSSMWKPIVMTGFTEGLGHGTYRPPIGVVRVHFMGARGLKNVEGMGGKSDPYVRVLSGMQVRAQTDYVLDDLDPEWDTVLYVPIHSIREDLVFEVMDYNDISKDKSIGLCNFLIKDIVKETKTENNQVIYDALEPVDKWVDLTNMERKKGKGQLHYVASFIPIMEFEKPKKEKPTAEANKDAAQEAPATPPQEPVDAAVAIPEKEIHGEVVKVTEDRTKVDLLAYESGVLTVTIHEVKLPEKYRVNTEILLDSVDPQYRTVELKGNHLPFNETGDAFVKEMDFSKVLVRVRPVRDNDKEDDDIGHWTTSVRDIVRKLMERNTNSEEEDEGEVYKLTNSNGGTIRLSFKFTPVVKFKLDPRESLENQGNLTVTAIKANNLTAADRGGTSDPYVVFSINEVKLHKTEVYQKQLNPVFKNETFTVPVPNRIGVKLKASVYDWDAVGKDKLLGETETAFDGQIIESFAAKDVELDLGSGATLRLRLLWQPQLLARKRQGTSLLGSTTRIFTAVPGAAFGVGKDALDLGFGAGTKVLGTGGKVIGGGVSAIGSGIRGIGRIGKKSSDASSDSSSVVVTPPQPAPTQSSQSGEGARSSMESSTQRLSAADANGSREGTFNIFLLGARNLTAMDKGGTSDPYARVRYGSKVVYKTKSIKKTLQPEWNESFTIKVSEGRSQLDIKVKDKNTLNDVDIGDCSIDVCNVVQDGQVFDGWLPLEPNGSGEVHIRVEAIAGGEGGNGTRQSLFGKMMS